MDLHGPVVGIGTGSVLRNIPSRSKNLICIDKMPPIRTVNATGLVNELKKVEARAFVHHINQTVMSN